MTDEIAQEKPQEENKPSPKPYSITELTKIIKDKVESLGIVWLTGEISNLKCHTSGHIYLTLKDSENQINAVIWRHTAKKIDFELKDGLEVLVSGELSIYGPQSKYQITLESIEPRGAGILLIAFENLKKKLAAQGLFDPRHKKALPYLPQKVCLITSPTGAAVQDIISVILRRCPNISILVYPVRVQGEGAAQEVANALYTVNEKLPDVDVIIAGRGGGSLEDLWAFNEEIVAHAIYASRIPVISAVGHEIDVTIADFVADKRALTPTEAGEIAVPRLDQIHEYLQSRTRQMQMAIQNRLYMARSYLDRLSSHRALIKPIDRVRHLQQRLDLLSQKLNTSMERYMQKRKMYLANISNQIALQQPLARIQRYHQHLDSLSALLSRAIQKRIDAETKRLHNLSLQLQALSPFAVLNRGYSISYIYSGEKVILDHKQVKQGDYIWTRLADSWILSVVYKTGTK
ncbi:MAG: exodeoxyribonuclease VII large subunit [Candidatus Brocadiae bacterium]|nr:exodeoxyribonuclease VII large subunit [Candidatus Brocadiia bacterium]